MKTFASESRPLRASALYRLLQCPAREVLLNLNVIEDSSGSAADTGSLVHEGIATFHRTKSTEKAIKAMKSVATKFPKGDISDATLSLKPYCNDPRNKEAEVVYSEVEVRFTLPCDMDDPYGDIHVVGHVDQIRREHGRLVLWDVKTGKRYAGWEMLHVAAAQLSAYCVGGCEKFGEPVYPGGIIRTYGYRVKGAKLPDPPGVFFSASWELSDCQEILRGISRRVMEIRQGIYTVSPGEHCSSCPAQGLSGCLPMLRSSR